MNLAYAGGGYDVPNMPYQQVLQKRAWYEALIDFFSQYGELGFIMACVCFTVIACFYIWVKVRKKSRKIEIV